jgi:hypothetical protein
MNRGLDPWRMPLRKPTLIMPPLMSLRDFLKDFIPPDYLIDGILQRRFVYAFTGQTGMVETSRSLRRGTTKSPFPRYRSTGPLVIGH